MPFKSEAQRRYLFSQHPDVAKEFAAHTPPDAELPERVGTSAKKPTKRKRYDTATQTYRSK